jgi:hypothetical protein
VRAAKIEDAERVRLYRRPDGAVYLVQGASGVRAVHAADLSPATVSETLALAVAADHARRRGLDPEGARMTQLARYDQWTVPNGYDAHRPLHRIALNDDARTELYVSSRTGEVVDDTTRRERGWNYVGSIVHWCYPTALRRDWAAWDITVWTLSLAALITALAGAIIGTLRVRVVDGRPASAYRGWHAWHHWLGIGCMFFVLTWIASGWLSMDHGRLFSTGKLSVAETSVLRGPVLDWEAAGEGVRPVPADAREIEWFVFDGRMYRRERTGLSSQRLFVAGEAAGPVRVFLDPNEVGVAARRLSPQCVAAAAVSADDAYHIASSMPQAPVYRVICGEAWYHIDGANGAVLEKLDPSRRAYRWFYTALHTLDFPALVARPVLRTSLVVVLCALGFAFSVTAVVIGFKRVMR